MLREILSKFSGGQLTAIILALIFVPGAVGAVVTFQPVAIVDASTGRRATVDSGGKFYVYDPVAGLRNNPANIVKISASNGGARCETGQQYVVPAGKALVITAMSGFVGYSYQNVSSSGFFIYDGVNCSGHLLLAHSATTTAETANLPFAIDLGVGVVVKAGKTVSIFSIYNKGVTMLYGYLVPASAAPTVTSAEIGNEPREITAEEVAAKLKQFK